VQVFPLPAGTPYANLNTCRLRRRRRPVVHRPERLRGQGRRAHGQVTVKEAPKGRGPYGICSTPGRRLVVLARRLVHREDRSATGESTVVEPPTKGQGARRVWSDSRGRIWVSEWNSGNVSMHDPAANTWRTWKLPGANPRTYAVYVDERDMVWLSDWGANAMVAFDPRARSSSRSPCPGSRANVRQILGRKGEVWLPESGTEHITVIKTA
jgi:virginiamycin B lyase